MMLKTVLVKHLKPNPFRRLTEYPIQREKVDALKESIGETGFWSNITGRQVGIIVEIAFGHHRLVALQESGLEQVEIVVRPLTNDQMLKMMARENMEEWGTSAWVELETLRSTIEAYGKGEITLPEVGKRGPRIETSEGSRKFYSKGTAAQFLGWTSKHKDGVQPNFACETAFRAMEMLDRGLLKESDLKGLSRSQMGTLVAGQSSIQRAAEKNAAREREELERAKKKAEDAADLRDKKKLEEQARIHEEQAKTYDSEARTKPVDFANKAADRFRAGEGLRQVEQLAQQMRPTVLVDPKIHKLGELADRIAKKLFKFRENKELAKDVRFLKKHKKELAARDMNGLCEELIAISVWAERLLKVFQGSSSHNDEMEIEIGCDYRGIEHTKNGDGQDDR